MAMKLQIFTITKILKLDCSHTCLAVINLDSTLKKDENYYGLFRRVYMYWEKIS